MRALTTLEPLPFPGILARIDARLERSVLRRQGGALDAPAHLLSSMADRSKLWIGIAGVRAFTGGGMGRAVAVRMVTTVGVQSFVLELGLKRGVRRRRPVAAAVPLRFGARRPPSSSFPSGHSAGGACAAVLLGEGTAYSPLLAILAAGVAWSRVHTGLHHATDVVAGLAIGTVVGLSVRRAWPLEARPERDGIPYRAP